MIDVWGFSCETAIRLMLLDLSDDKSTLFQVMKKKKWFMVRAGVIGLPFLSFLDGTPHKEAWQLFYTLHEIQQHFVVSHG